MSLEKAPRPTGLEFGAKVEGFSANPHKRRIRRLGGTEDRTVLHNLGAGSVERPVSRYVVVGGPARESGEGQGAEIRSGQRRDSFGRAGHSERQGNSKAAPPGWRH
jgi:hypothetical protein